jgi:hypothetical protein
MKYLVLIVQLVIIISFALITCVLITINNILYRITTRSSQKNKKFDSAVNLRLRWVYFDLKRSHQLFVVATTDFYLGSIERTDGPGKFSSHPNSPVLFWRRCIARAPGKTQGAKRLMKGMQDIFRRAIPFIPLRTPCIPAIPFISSMGPW